MSLGVVEENPFQGGWGGTVASIVAASVRLPFADSLEQQVIPTVGSVISAARELCEY